MLVVENVNLTGHFLIAMPAMTDPYFAKSLTYIFEHTDQGAMGLVVNRPLEINMDHVFSQLDLDIKHSPLALEHPGYGGPVQMERGFILHQPVGNWDGTIASQGQTAVTISKDVLQAIAQGQGPEKFLLVLGFAGWSAGQLEDELSQNAWLTVEAQDHIIFDLPPQEKLNAAMHILGVNAASLPEVAGHA